MSRCSSAPPALRVTVPHRPVGDADLSQCITHLSLGLPPFPHSATEGGATTLCLESGIGRKRHANSPQLSGPVLSAPLGDTRRTRRRPMPNEGEDNGTRPALPFFDASFVSHSTVALPARFVTSQPREVEGRAAAQGPSREGSDYESDASFAMRQERVDMPTHAICTTDRALRPRIFVLLYFTSQIQSRLRILSLLCMHFVKTRLCEKHRTCLRKLGINVVWDARAPGEATREVVGRPTLRLRPGSSAQVGSVAPLCASSERGCVN